MLDAADVRPPNSECADPTSEPDKTARLTDASGAGEVGVIGLADLLLGLPINTIREVIAVPPVLEAMPVPARHILGAVILRGQMIPVLSLRSWLGLPAEEVAGVILVLRHEERILGVLADCVVNLVSLKNTQRQSVSRRSGDLLEEAYLTATNAVMTMLAVDRLFDIPGLPSAALAETMDFSDQATQIAYLHFVVSGIDFLAPMEQIASSIPSCLIVPGAVAGGTCLGLISRHGIEMAIMDTAPVFGFQATERPPSETAGIVIGYPENGHLALRIDEVSDILRLRDDDVLPFPRMISRRSDLLAGVHLDQAGKQFYVIDVNACRQTKDLASLAAVAHSVTKEDRRGRLKKSVTHKREMFLVFDAGGASAARVADIVEIIRPDAQLSGGDNHDAQLARLSHNGRLIPVLDLSALLGRGTSSLDAHSAVIIVEKGKFHYGLAAHRLHSIEPGIYYAPRNAVLDHNGFPDGALVEVGQGSARQMKSFVDLPLLLPDSD